MADISKTDREGRLARLDRHALVMTIWTPFGAVAVTLLHRGLVAGDGWWIAAGVAAILIAFAGHVIANAVTGTRFTQGEVALAGVAYAASLAAFLVSALVLSAEALDGILMPAGLGLGALLLAVVLYMVIHFGARAAFARFDVIRDNNLRPASWLAHRGGRR